MLCSTCSKLATLQTKKTCNQCQGAVFSNISVICDACSNASKRCSACLKRIIPAGASRQRGCNCGRK